MKKVKLHIVSNSICNFQNFEIIWKCKAEGEEYPDDTTPLPITKNTINEGGCFGNGPGTKMEKFIFDCVIFLLIP